MKVLLTISKLFIILFRFCENKEYTWYLQKQISKLFFQMSAQVYSLPSPTEGRKKAFFGGGKHRFLSSKLSLTYGGNVNHFKSVHHLSVYSACGNREHLTVFKTNQYIQVYSLGQNEGVRKAFFGGCKKGCPIMKLPPRAFGCYERLKKSLLLWNLK